jgi:hypothetical protein
MRKSIFPPAETAECGFYQPGERIRKQGVAGKRAPSRTQHCEPIWKRCWTPKEIQRAWSDGRARRSRKLVEALTRQGHTIGETAIRRM